MEGEEGEVGEVEREGCLFHSFVSAFKAYAQHGLLHGQWSDWRERGGEGREREKRRERGRERGREGGRGEKEILNLHEESQLSYFCTIDY